MNKKGFTLVETILVVAILALLMLILVPNVIVLINKNNKESCENLKDNIISATKIYVNTNKYDLGFVCNIAKNITLQTLVDSGDLKIDNNDLINPKDNTKIDLSSSVEVTYNCTNRTFSYIYDLNCE